MNKPFFIIIFVCMIGSVGLATEKFFPLERLPLGKGVTLPHPAATLIPLGQQIRLTSTDMPQTIKLTLKDAKPGHTVKVSIYDSHSEKVQKLDLAGGGTALYSFKKLSTIRLIPHGKKNLDGIQLLVESNKPLGIAR